MRLLVVGCVLLFANRAHAQVPLTGPPVPVLAGHLQLDLPGGMELGPETDHTRAVLEVDDGRFVMTVHETYRRVGVDLRAGVLAELRSQGASLARSRVQRVQLGELAAIAVYPPLGSAGADANLVHAMYVASDDGTVQVFGFYATGAARDSAHAWAELAERMTRTISAGPAELDRHAGLLELGGRRLRIECHDDCAIRIVGAGYQVRPIVPLGRTQQCTLDDGPAIQRPRSTRRAAQLLGRDVVWLEWTDTAGAHAATMVAIGGEDDLRVVCVATSRFELESVRAVVDAMTFE